MPNRVTSNVVLMGICLMFLMHSHAESLTLDEIQAGIVAREKRIHTLQWRQQESYLASEYFPEFPVGVYLEKDFYWDDAFNISVKGNAISYDRKKLIRGRYAWTPLRSDWIVWNHKKYIHLHPDEKMASFYNKPPAGLGGLYFLPPMRALGYAFDPFDSNIEWTLGQTLERNGMRFADVPAETIEGHETVAIETTIPDIRGPHCIVRLWIAPDMQFVPLRIETIVPTTKKLGQRYERIQYTKIDGVALPESMIYTAYDNRKEGVHLLPPMQVIYSNMKLNVPVRDIVDEIDFVEGTVVRDEDTGAQYEIVSEKNIPENES